MDFIIGSDNGYFSLKSSSGEIASRLDSEALIIALNELSRKWYYLKLHISFEDNIPQSLQTRALAIINAHNLDVDRGIDR